MNETTQKLYDEKKAAHPDRIILVRLGDFYEALGADARTVAKVLEITLTQRKGIDLTGMPYHVLERWVAKLLLAGHKVAVIDGNECSLFDVEDKQLVRKLISSR